MVVFLLLVQWRSSNPAPDIGAVGFEFVTKNRREGAFLGLYLKAVHVEDKCREEEECDEVCPGDGAAGEDDEEAQIHWVAGAAVDSRLDQRGGGFGFCGVNGGFGAFELNEAECGEAKSQEAERGGYGCLEWNLEVEGGKPAGAEPYEQGSDDDEGGGWDF